MSKGIIGGDYALSPIKSIDEEFGIVPDLGPSEIDFNKSQTTDKSIESPLWPQSGYSHPPLKQDSRVNNNINASKNLTEDTGNFQITFPDWKPLREEWLKNGAVNISSLFPTPQAESIHKWYFDKPNDWWNLVLYPDPNFDYNQNEIDNPGYYHMYHSSGSDVDYPNVLNYIHQINNNGGFSYIYRRTGTNPENYFHTYLKMFQNPLFKDFLSKITGYEGLEYKDQNTFVSNYESGHYNGPHTDGDNGRVAFVYHLSKDWKPQYGGLFMRMDWDWKTINKVIVPPFNTLTIFDTQFDGKPGSPHLVSEVAQDCSNKRISYTGWYL